MRILATTLFATMAATAGHASTVTILTDAEFSNAVVEEQVFGELRDGKTLATGDWEFGVGTNTQDAGSSVNGQLIHASTATAFSFGFDASLSELFFDVGGDRLTYGVASDALASFNAFGIRVDGRDTSRGDEGDVYLSDLSLNGMNLGDLSGVNSASVMLISDIDYTQDFTLTGSYLFDYTGLSQGEGAGSRPQVNFKLAEIAPVPLPASALLLLVGIGGFGALRLRG